MIHVSNNLQQMLNKHAEDDKACWKNYTQVGTKMKGGREVPNCVPASKDIPDSRPRKRKTEKKAYGVSDYNYEYERWIDGGAPWGRSRSEAAELTRRFSEEAAKQKLKLMFSPDRYTEGNITPDEAIKRIMAVKTDDDLNALNDDNLPYFYTLLAPENAQIDYANHPLGKVLDKKAADISGAETIVDAPIKCTPGFGCKRYLTPQEKVQVEEAKKSILPALFPTSADPVYSGISSPEWSAVGHGALGALLGAGLGAGVGRLTDNSVPLSAGLGGLLGGLGAGLYGYGTKIRKNKEIEDTMEDLPVGADLGDMEVFSDPRLKAQLARDFQRQLVRKGLMG